MAIKNYVSIGADTETFNGQPFVMQFASKSLKLEKFIWCNGKTSTRKFLEFCDSLDIGNYVMWFHNLDYDMVSIFYDRHIILKNEEFSFEAHGWTVEGVYSSICFANLKKGNKVIHIRDTFAYYKTSLAKLADMFCPELPKLSKPKELGDKIYTADDKEFCEYAMRDSVITDVVGRYILERHSEYGIGLSVSAPHFSANVFRTKFMTKDIPLPSKGKIYSALLSYHGGKNNLTVPYGWYQNVTLLDIASAYPAAMAELPSFYQRENYHLIEGGKLTDELPRYGIYRISGVAKKCQWPILYDSAFHPIEGEFTDIWTTGPELNEGLRNGELEISKVYGYFYDDVADKNESPFKGFAETFYSLKDKQGIQKTERDFYKLILNSLYGKFIQSRGEKDHLSYYYDLDKMKLNKEKMIIAGGLFHPFIATLITGIVRANIHKLEHKYLSLHTATDGIFTMAKNCKEKPGLGGLKIEAKGDLLIFRNKLYILYSSRESHLPSRVFKGKYICKYALHGFRGSVYDLEKIYVTGNPTYEYKKVNKLRESLRRGLDVNKFETQQGSLNLETITDGDE